MTTILGGITLDNDLVWSDEYKFYERIAGVTQSIGGGLIIQEFNRNEPIIITLQTQDGQGYQKKPTVEALKRLASVVGATYGLRIDHNDKTLSKTVRFRSEVGDAGAVDFEMSHACDGLQTDDFWYSGTIYLMCVESAELPIVPEEIIPGTAPVIVYNAPALVIGDTDLLSENIKSGVTIFGVEGEIVSAIGDAVAADVKVGKSFSSEIESGIAGTMPVRGNITYTPGTATQTIPEGYHGGSGKVLGDSDLIAGNIRWGTNIFGVTGNVIEAVGSATNADILMGKNVGDILGIMPNRGAVVLEPGTAAQEITYGYHNGSGYVTGDADLIPENIKPGVTIFGVDGGMPINEMKITPGTSTQYITEGYHNSKGYVAGDADLIAGNIKSGISIFGVNGVIVPSDMENIGAIHITPGTEAQYIPTGYHNGTSYVDGDVDLLPVNIKRGISIFGVGVADTVFEGEADWIDISSVGDNEINLLVSDLVDAKIAFKVTTASGTYSINWGDGNTETGCVSGTKYAHAYSVGTGQACSLGYTTFKIRIYDATDAITGFNIMNHPDCVNQVVPLLSATLGTTGLLDCSYMFSLHDIIYQSTPQCLLLQYVKMPTNATAVTSLSSTFSNCLMLKTVILPDSLDSCTTLFSCFFGCRSIKKIILPLSMPLCNTAGSCFFNCHSLYSLVFPTAMPLCTSLNGCFQGCHSLRAVTLPENLDVCSNMLGCFRYCYSLSEIVLPDLPECTTLYLCFDSCFMLKNVTMPETLPKCTTIANMFYNCYSLESVTFPDTMALCTTAVNCFNSCYSLHSVELASMPIVTTMDNCFANCLSLKQIVLPNLPLCTIFSSIFTNCQALTNVTFGTVGGVTTMASAFSYCYSITNITLPTLSSVITASNTFYYCTSLQSIVNIENFGSTTIGLDLSTIFISANGIIALSLNCKLSKLFIAGSASLPYKLNSLRLTNATSTFTGTSPQINVSYTSLGQAALVQLFNDLPTLTGKTINITGATGAASLTAGERAIATGKGWTITG